MHILINKDHIYIYIYTRVRVVYKLGIIVCWTSKVMVLCWRTPTLEHFARRHSGSVKLGHMTQRTGCSRLRRENSGEMTFLPPPLSSSSLSFSLLADTPCRARTDDRSEGARLQSTRAQLRAWSMGHGPTVFHPPDQVHDQGVLG